MEAEMEHGANESEHARALTQETVIDAAVMPGGGGPVTVGGCEDIAQLNLKAVSVIARFVRHRMNRTRLDHRNLTDRLVFEGTFMSGTHPKP